jgi:hypothetical protein
VVNGTIKVTLQLKEYKTEPWPKLEDQFFINFHVFCATYEPEIVLTVLLIKTKTISGLKHVSQKMII